MSYIILSSVRKTDCSSKALHRVLAFAKPGWKQNASFRSFGSKRRGMPDIPILPKDFMVRTGSPNVFIAKAAVTDLKINARKLFVENNKLPGRFKGANFSYIHPKSLKYELPIHRRPEIAFIGRSNVGKSSLINALSSKLQRVEGSEAFVSKRPGRTQQVNYFAISPKSYKIPHDKILKNSNVHGYFIDLPGYGFAKAPKEKIEAWTEITQEFLHSREADILRRVFILIDARVGELEVDLMIMRWFDELDLPYTIVLTKADKAKKVGLTELVNRLCMHYDSQIRGEETSTGSMGPTIHVTSSKRNIGINELFWAINAEFDSV
mmetsp:Transcript_2772/g.3874  ORF Transcript_2772/g.3874 Transcript_2772/m.3874 type:complete len:322 (-) Transcript_2772:527-1492(-)|eukprot:CAMPEP_0116054348 /NCGR_PEP_ID=MMETSP0322-20121206/2745_1 /TAXON_ID=163516 /ORGANISM="Leptocylindrus danicus var. apora, Strain B651" /LENGTH=321 /DNA_ID=CAMNT_0003537717 /DNA_START=205 /DNA_END=1170 /DNA_ORIENTATION=-